MLNPLNLTEREDTKTRNFPPNYIQQVCYKGGSTCHFSDLCKAIYFIFKCKHPLHFEGGQKRTIPCSASFFIAWQLVFMTQLELTRERFLFIEQLPLLYVDLPLRFRPLGHSAWVCHIDIFAHFFMLCRAKIDFGDV